ncbi:MAG: acetate kinase [Candidatus Marinimicrobia bacterium]|nr:acetate kinase [Candidatus Neomarinimicrobiota bacterium]
MNVLTINSGSSSVKYQLIQPKKEKVLCKGLVERIGIDGTRIKHKIDGEKVTKDLNIDNHKGAIDSILEIITDDKIGALNGLDEIDALGHRLVHGGDKFSESVLIDDEVMQALRECIDFAPLHNPPNIKGVEAAEEKLKGKPNVGVFDTAFHSTLPPEAYLYAIPYKYYREESIRKYGFHGTSHYFVANKAAKIIDRDIENMKIITCHLGNGASITAVKNGKSIDTSMGFTPLEGLVMGTRSGDIDPGVIFYIAEEEDMSVEEANQFFNKKCGVLGLSEDTSDMRDLEEKALAGEKQYEITLDVYHYRIKKYISAYIGIMNGVDAIVFTGGVGENSDYTRADSLKDMENLGIMIDPKKNDGLRGEEALISTDDSEVDVLVIPTNEELVIAQETARVLEKQ